jgi:hypothetical protein
MLNIAVYVVVFHKWKKSQATTRVTDIAHLFFFAKGHCPLVNNREYIKKVNKGLTIQACI